MKKSRNNLPGSTKRPRLKKGGSKYIEAEHIKPKHQKGRETLENIILLSPNHHKEFDLGDRVIKSHENNFIEILLNGQRYKIDLTTELSTNNY
ncbi:MAG: HNH endonuclease [Balneolaceae bacterium]|nr:HNH endonuclease [Balneolaceae bacterium]